MFVLLVALSPLSLVVCYLVSVGMACFTHRHSVVVTGLLHSPPLHTLVSFPIAYTTACWSPVHTPCLADDRGGLAVPVSVAILGATVQQFCLLLVDRSAPAAVAPLVVAFPQVDVVGPWDAVVHLTVPVWPMIMMRFWVWVLSSAA